MQLDKQTVLDHMSQLGIDNNQIQQAVQVLPDQIDLRQGAGLLQQFGVDPHNLLSQVAGGDGGGLGGLLGGLGRQAGLDPSEAADGLFRGSSVPQTEEIDAGPAEGGLGRMQSGYDQQQEGGDQPAADDLPGAYGEQGDEQRGGHTRRNEYDPMADGEYRDQPSDYGRQSGNW